MPEEAKVTKFETTLSDNDLSALIRIAQIALGENGVEWELLAYSTKLDDTQLARLNMKVTNACLAGPINEVQSILDKRILVIRLQNIINELKGIDAIDL